MNAEDEIEPNDREVSKINIDEEVLRIVASHDDKTAPRALLDAAKDPASPLHHCFTWDDSVAGERYRLAQAGTLYRRVKLTVIRLDAEQREVKFETVRAVVSVPADRTKTNSKSYGRTTTVMNDEQRRASVLRGIVRDLVALRNKYAKFSELNDVWVVIEDAALMYDPPSVKKTRKHKHKPSAPPLAG